MPKVKLYNRPNRKVYRKAALHTKYDVLMSTSSNQSDTTAASNIINEENTHLGNINLYSDNSDTESSFSTDGEGTLCTREVHLKHIGELTISKESALNWKSDPVVLCNENNSELDPSKLAEWSVESKVPHVYLNTLLQILKPYHKHLPLDARTLLKTPRKLNLKFVQPGQYYHFGVRNAVLKLIAKCPAVQSVEICINIDGLPIAKSSGSQLYPILCNLYCNPNEVQIIGLYHGNDKPKNANNLLEDLINEVVSLTSCGIDYNEKCYEFKIKAFICDAPAKSFILFTKGHTGYHSCSKCYIEGEYYDRIFFAETEDLVKRDDNSFRTRIDEDHHTGTSLIENIPGFDMVNGIPLDYMHLICLGVTRKLLLLWVTGRPPTKLSYQNILVISQHLTIQINNIPCELVRKPRGLEELKRWKATEFRQFLVYTGPVVLKSILPYVFEFSKSTCSYDNII